MNYSTLLRRYAGWGLALGVMVACGTQDNTPPSSYGYPENLDAGGTQAVSAATPAPSSTASSSGGDMSSSSGSSSGDQSSSSSSSSSGGTGVCPSSCKTATDCSSCPSAGTGKNCCVMGLCVMMASCPVIRDSGRDGS